LIVNNICLFFLVHGYLLFGKEGFLYGLLPDLGFTPYFSRLFMTYMKKNYADEVAYSITKRRAEEVPNPPNYTLNGNGSCGIMSMDSGWGREGFILDLKGLPIRGIRSFLQDLVNFPL
jgi:hypothetical protein